MIKLIKLIYIKFLSSTNIERIKKAKEENIRDNNETKLIIYSIIYLIVGYLIYLLLVNYFNNLKLDILVIGYAVSYFVLLYMDINGTKDTLFSREDDYLFSLPLKQSDIIISKLSIVYVKNLLTVLVIMLPTYIVCNNNSNISDVSGFVYLLASLMLPIIPIIISSIYAIIDTYYKESSVKKKYFIIRTIIFILLLLFITLLFKGIDYSNINSIINRASFLNPFIYLFKVAIVKNNIIFILCLLILPIYLFYLFTNLLSINYGYILSKLRGVKLVKNIDIVIEKRHSLLIALIKKEFRNLKNNKLYYNFSISNGILLTIIYIVLGIFLIPNMNIDKKVLGLILMLVVSVIASINCSTICSFSLEKENIIYIKSLPIKFYKLFIAKWILNILIVLPIILVNAIYSVIVYKLELINLLYFIINPLSELLFISFLGLVLDYRFINYKEGNDSDIIKGRLMNYVPFIISFLVAILLLFLVVSSSYNLIMISFCGINIFALICLFIYLLFSYKRIYKDNL